MNLSRCVLGYLPMEIQQESKSGCCCGCARARNLLAAGAAHGEKLAALILSFPESQGDGASPESPEQAVLATRHVCSMQCTPRGTMQHPL